MNHKKILLAIALAVTGLSNNLFAMPSHQPVPGGIASLAIAPTTAKRPIVSYEGHRVTVIPYNNEWVALVGIPLKASAGQHQITIKHPVSHQQFDAPFTVLDKKYRLQRLTIKDRNKVNPDKSSSQRIVDEMQIQQKLKQQFTEIDASLNFLSPVAGRDSGRFGLRRIINGENRSPHSGMDIAAPSGTPIKATENGKILYTGNFFFSGNVVYVDHGSGVISMYAHLSKINVNAGDFVRRGETIGLVGKTGRVTGPHLHWSVYLNGEAIDPSLFNPKSY